MLPELLGALSTHSRRFSAAHCSLTVSRPCPYSSRVCFGPVLVGLVIALSCSWAIPGLPVTFCHFAVWGFLSCICLRCLDSLFAVCLGWLLHVGASSVGRTLSCPLLYTSACRFARCFARFTRASLFDVNSCRFWWAPSRPPGSVHQLSCSTTSRLCNTLALHTPIPYVVPHAEPSPLWFFLGGFHWC